MPTDTKCIYWSRSENLSGKPILLTITKYDDKTMEVALSYATEDTLHRKSLLLFLITLVNLFSLFFKVISTNYCIAIFVVVFFVTYSVAFTVKQERILIVKSLGYQIEIHYTLGQTVRFVAWQNIKALFINEVVSKQRVIFILALLTKDTVKEASAIIPLFTEIMPRLSSIEAVYQYIENCHD